MRHIYLSKKQKKIFGVCGGIGEAFDIDPNAVRLLVIFLCLATAVLPMVLTYFIAWAILPEERIV